VHEILLPADDKRATTTGVDDAELDGLSNPTIAKGGGLVRGSRGKEKAVDPSNLD
jgi:hypothetical protein